MTDRVDPAKAASRILRERAMAILRDTRAKIDPQLLAAMKDHLASVIPQDAMGAGAAPPKVKPRNERETVFKPEAPQAAPIRPKKPEPAPSVLKAEPNGMEPVDRQKIAQIVLQYMKNRDDQQKH